MSSSAVLTQASHRNTSIIYHSRGRRIPKCVNFHDTLNYLKVGAPNKQTNKQTGTKKAHWVCTKASQSAEAYNLKGRLRPVSHGGCRGGGALLQAVALSLLTPGLRPLTPGQQPLCEMCHPHDRHQDGSGNWRVPLYTAAWTWHLAHLLTCRWPKQAT